MAAQSSRYNIMKPTHIQYLYVSIDYCNSAHVHTLDAGRGYRFVVSARKRLLEPAQNMVKVWVQFLIVLVQIGEQAISSWPGISYQLFKSIGFL